VCACTFPLPAASPGRRDSEDDSGTVPV